MSTSSALGKDHLQWWAHLQKWQWYVWDKKIRARSTTWSRWLAAAALFSLSTSLVRTLDRAQESGKEAPSAQTTETMDPEIPLSWEITMLSKHFVCVCVRELSSFRTAPQAKNLYVHSPKTVRKHCFEPPNRVAAQTVNSLNPVLISLIP